MTHIDWSIIENVNEDDIKLENVDYFADELREAIPDKLNRDQLLHTFNIVQLILNIRTEQLLASQEDSTDVRRQLKNIQNQNEELEKENEELQRLVSANQSSRDIMDEKKRLSSQYEQYETEAENNKKRMDELSQLRDNLTVNNNDLKKKVDQLEEENRILYDKCGFLHTRLKEKPDAPAADDLKLRKEMSSLRSQLRVQKTAIDILADRDAEIVNLYEELRILRNQMRDRSVDTDKFKVDSMTKTLRQREEQIQTLKQKLGEATEEVERSTTLLEEMRSELDRVGEGTHDHKVDRIKHLQTQLQEREVNIVNLEKRTKLAEEATQFHASEVSSLEKRLKRFEDGEYGLTEAVSELKVLKSQLASKDRQLEELCRAASQAESAVNQTNLENEVLRTRLGLSVDEPIDVDGYYRQKTMKQEEERAVNVVLQKEIEKLEDERLDLKRRLREAVRRLSQHTNYSEAVDLATTKDFNDDAVEQSGAEEFITAGSAGSVNAAPPTRSRLRPLSDVNNGVVEEAIPQVWRSRVSALNSELTRASEQTAVSDKELEGMKLQLSHVTDANVCLEAGLKELEAQLQANQDETLQKLNGNQPMEIRMLECPTLNKLLATLDARHLGEDFDQGRFLKSRIDHLEGANNELRREVRELRLSTATSELHSRQLEEKMRVRNDQLRALQSLGGGDPLTGDEMSSTQPLPSNLTPDSERVIGQLEEHMAHVLNELEVKEKKLTEMDLGMEGYRRKFAVCRHRQGLLYRDFEKERENWMAERKKLTDKLQQAETNATETVVYKSELTRLQQATETNQTGGKNASDSHRQNLAELSRQLTLLRVNEAGLIRRYVAAQEREKMLRKENTSLKSELVQLECAVHARLGYYSRHKETMAFQMGHLHKQLDQSVPQSEHDKLMREHEQLASKYQEILKRSTLGSATDAALKSTQLQLSKLQDEYKSLKAQLAVEKERRSVLEAFGRGDSSGKQISATNDATLWTKKLALLEMKELNERERANHAVHMLESVKQSQQQLEQRNQELEHKVVNLTSSSLTLQRVEQELREELAEAVPRYTSTVLEQKLQQTEKINLSLRHEAEQLKEVALISVAQTQRMEQQQVAHEFEADSLRQQLEELEAKDDDRAALARLHRYLTQLQVSESTAVRRLSTTQAKAVRLENIILKLEQRISGRETELSNQRNKHRQRDRFLKDYIRILRVRYIGCVTLTEQEKLSSRYTKIVTERIRLQIELDDAMAAKIKVESEMEGERTRQGMTEEIKQILVEYLPECGQKKTISLLNSKLVDWQSKFTNLRVHEAGKHREVERLRQQLHHLEIVVNNQEAQLSGLEVENAQLIKELDQRELDWENREAELQDALMAAQPIQAEVINVATNLDVAESALKATHFSNTMQARQPAAAAAENLPDSTLPQDEQLHQAIDSIKRHIVVMFDQRVEIEGLKKRIVELVRELRAQEQRSTVHQLPERECVRPETNSVTMTSLQMNVDLLQRRLTAKEESLAKAQDLLKQAHLANEEAQDRHTREIMELKAKLHEKMETAVVQLSHTVESAGRPSKSAESANAKRARDLEDALAEQNQVVLRQMERSRQLHQDSEMWRQQFEELQANALSEQEAMEQTIRQHVKELKSQCSQLRGDVEDKDCQITDLSAEVKRWKQEASRSPSVMQRQLTERLKSNLAEKDKQLQALSGALADLRRDLVNQAEQAVLATSTTTPVTPRVERVLVRKTAPLQAPNPGLNPSIRLDGRHINDLEQEKSLEQRNSQLVTQLHCVEKEKKQLEDECCELRSQLDRIKRIRTLGGDGSNRRQLEEMKIKINKLEETNERLRKTVPEKLCPDANHTLRETAQAAKTASSQDWETRKRLEAEVARLKQKMVAKSMEFVELQKQLEMAKNGLERTVRENEMLRERVTERWGPGALPSSRDDAEYEVAGQPRCSNSIHERVDLHKQVDELKSEVERLRRAERISLDLPANANPMGSVYMELKASEARVRLLEDRIHVLERQLVDRGLVSESKLKIDQAVQQDLLRLNRENLELKFELESARADLPRYRSRIQDLQSFVDVLKREKEELCANRPLNKSFGSDTSLGSNIRKIGESGKSTKELERIIARMKRVLQQSLTENERLKSAPGVVVQEETKKLRAENAKLRQSVEEAQLAAGTRLSGYRTNSEQRVMRLSQEYEQLRKSYEGVISENERIKNRLRASQEFGTEADDGAH